MASGVFGLKKVYKRQVENINNGNFVSWTENFTQGYIMAGAAPSGTPNNRSSIVRYNYTDDLSFVIPSASLPASNGLTSSIAVFNTNYGYYAGGANPNTNIISRLDFSTELNSLPGTNLPTIVENAASVSRSNESYGYFIGGVNPALTNPKAINTITRLDFTTETLSPMPNLPTATQGIRGFDGTTYGYAVGGGVGNPAVPVNTIYRLDFSNNTLAVSLPTKNLITARTQSIVNKSPLYGYVSSGGGTPITSIERLDFSTENFITLATTADPGSNGTGFSSSINGYMIGLGPGNNLLSRLSFSTETFTSNIGLGAESRSNSSTVSATHKRYNNVVGTYGYSNRGSNGSAIDKMFIPTETWSNSSATTSDNQSLTMAAASNDYGYIFAGKKGAGNTSLITRIDFSSDTNASSGKRDKSSQFFYFPASVTSLQDAGVTQTNSYAYYIAGTNNSSSYIWRMDFGTEDFDLRGTFPGGIDKITASIKSASTGYFVKGNSVVYRLNFSNETFSSNLTYPITLTNSGVSACTYSERYGYFLGGQNSALTPSNLSSVYRIDFSNDTFALLNTYTPASKTNPATSFSSDLAGYILNLQDSNNSSVHRLDFGTEVLTLLPPSTTSRADCVALTNANT